MSTRKAGTRRIITLRVTGEPGTQEVIATCYGIWAVHQASYVARDDTRGTDPDFTSVTHVPSGLLLLTLYQTERNALHRLARWLDDHAAHYLTADPVTEANQFRAQVLPLIHAAVDAGVAPDSWAHWLAERAVVA